MTETIDNFRDAMRQAGLAPPDVIRVDGRPGRVHVEGDRLRRIAASRALPDWQKARELGKADRRNLTDAVKALCERAHERGDSTTLLPLWITTATKLVTSSLFQTKGERIAAIRDRLTQRQLRRLAMAEEIYASAIVACLDTDLHHRAVYEQAKAALQAFAAATGGREVPGVEFCPARLLLKQRGCTAPETSVVIALVAGPVAQLVMLWLYSIGLL